MVCLAPDKHENVIWRASSLLLSINDTYSQKSIIDKVVEPEEKSVCCE